MGPFEEVLRAAREGRERALESIYRDLAPAVLGYLRAQRAAEPEDLTSEVFVGVVRGLASFSGDAKSFRSWVFSIAHRRLIDERRRLARSREDPADPVELASGPAGGAQGDVEAEGLARLGSRWAADLLDTLTDVQRTVVLLRVVADLSVRQVAEITGRSPGAVKTMQRRALLQLARRIEREGVSG
ncbi:MAG TPA: RNA polymerase sigma factor [Actinomycetota bacterium]|nr:RNA polymerase sigma factor [Actinomycetota bacterium]